MQKENPQFRNENQETSKKGKKKKQDKKKERKENEIKEGPGGRLGESRHFYFFEFLGKICFGDILDLEFHQQ